MRGLLLGVVLMAVVAGCSSPPPAAVSPVRVEITKGTAVDLVLAKQIDAGDAKEGETVPLLVASDVCDPSGNVIVSKGTVVQAEVTNSRSEGTLSGLMNRPARLDVTLKDVQAVDGTPLSLTVDTEKPDEPYRFTRENTGRPGVESEKVDDLLKNELNRQVAEKLSEAFNGETPDLSGPDAQAALNRFASELGLNDTKKLLDSGKGDAAKISSTIERLQRGDLSGVTKGDLSLTLGSVMELANLAGGLGDRLSRTLKGRTIRAYPGTVVHAYVKDTFSVMLPPKEPVRS